MYSVKNSNIVINESTRTYVVLYVILSKLYNSSFYNRILELITRHFEDTTYADVAYSLV
jgi:hypothetical protein